MYKIPGRSIVCSSPLEWIKEMVWVYIVMKLFRSDINAITEKPEIKSVTVDLKISDFVRDCELFQEFLVYRTTKA